MESFDDPKVGCVACVDLWHHAPNRKRIEIAIDKISLLTLYCCGTTCCCFCFVCVCCVLL